MSVNEIDPEEEDRAEPYNQNHQGLSAAQYRETQDELRERQELIHALRNFAEHFGAATVYREARAIYRESPDGKAETEGEAAAAFESALKDASRPLSERQKRPAPGRRPGGSSAAAAAAKRLLGG